MVLSAKSLRRALSLFCSFTLIATIFTVVFTVKTSAAVTPTMETSYTADFEGQYFGYTQSAFAVDLIANQLRYTYINTSVTADAVPAHSGTNYVTVGGTGGFNFASRLMPYSNGQAIALGKGKSYSLTYYVYE